MQCLKLLRRVALCASLVASTAAHSAPLLKPFSIEAGLAMAQISEFAESIGSADKNLLASGPGVSPDGATIAFVVRRANLLTRLNEYQLLSIRSHDALRFVRQRTRSDLPPLKLVAQFDTASSVAGVTGIEWLNDSTLSFIGTRTEDGDVSQVYCADLRSHTVEKVTASPTSIRSVSWNEGASTLVYSAAVTPDWRDREYGFVIDGGKDFMDTVRDDPRSVTLLRYYALHLGAPQPLPLPFESDTAAFPGAVSVSADGRWAIRVVTPDRIPSSWDDYQSVQYYRGYRDWRSREQIALTDVGTYANERDAAFGGRNGRVQQLVLIDLKRGTTRALLDSPMPLVDLSVEWTSGDSVVVHRAYRPLEESEGAERTRRAETPVDIEISLVTPRFSEIRSAGPVKPTPRADSQIEFLYVNNISKAPAVVGVDKRSNRQAVLTDLNPQLRELDLGQLRDYHWRDSLGREWGGILALPTASVRKGPLPIVIQLNEYSGSNTSFNLNGSGQTSHLGRAFLGKNIAVLQTSCTGAQPAKIYEQYESNPDFGALKSVAICIDGAIDALARDAEVDPALVALLGFSYSGNYVTYSSTFGHNRPAAGVVVDSVQSTLASYLFSYGMARPGMLTWDAETPFGGFFNGWIGDQIRGRGVEKWIARSPTFNTERINTPLLFEHHGADVPCSCWDVFVLLKRQFKPVELMQYPKGTHNLVRVAEKLRSQHNILDWISFWLLGEERKTPAPYTDETVEQLQSQYERWRTFRERRKSISIAKPNPSD